MIIVTPAVGSVPEPRPQSLVTGDRAIQLLDASASSALQAAGVNLVTVTLSVYNEITSELVAQTPEIDPVTGALKTSLMPAYLSPAAISALNLLDSTSHLSETFVPPRLSATTLTATIQGASASTAADPDGTPVIVANPTTGTSVTYSGTVTGATVTAGLLHGDSFTANVSTVGTEEITQAMSLDDQVTLPVAAPNKVKVYSSGQRPSYVDSAGSVYLIGNKRIVTSWPAPNNSLLGDEAILSTTGEHRIYKGTTKGWRLASPHSVSSVTERAALQPYNGMRVFCDFGHPQDHVYKADSKWHGTEQWFVTPGPIITTTGVNDTNWHRWNETTVMDPGFDYMINGAIDIEVAQLTRTSRVEIWFSTCDYQTGAGVQTHDIGFYDGFNSQQGQVGSTYARFNIPLMTKAVQSGSRTALVDWHLWGTNTNAYSGWYQAGAAYWAVPV